MAVLRKLRRMMITLNQQNFTAGDAQWKIPECWRDESHESHRKKCQLNLTACPTRSNASVSERWEQRGSKCPIRLAHAQVDSSVRRGTPRASRELPRIPRTYSCTSSLQFKCYRGYFCIEMSEKRPPLADSGCPPGAVGSARDAGGRLGCKQRGKRVRASDAAGGDAGR